MTEQVTGIYPSEVVDLPSKGFFYPEGSPLRSGKVDVKYMTAKEEDILTSTNLIQKGVVLDKLMDSLILTKGVKSSDLLLGDLNAVMVAARILGYGKDYTVGVQCPSCNRLVEQKVDLTQLQTQNEPQPGDSAEFTIVLPISKAELTLKFLTRGDEFKIEKEIKALKKVDNDLDYETTTRLKTIVTAVNGERSQTKIWTFVDNMLVRDARYLREEYRTKMPDVDFNIPLDCVCGTTEKARMPVGPDFFWPDARV